MGRSGSVKSITEMPPWYQAWTMMSFPATGISELIVVRSNRSAVSALATNWFVSSAGDGVSNVMRKLVAAHQFEVPETLVEHQTNHRVQTLMREMMGQGVDPRQTEINWEGVKDEMRAQAADDVRGSMLLEHIAERENLSVTDEEVEEEINRIAQASRQAVEQVRAALTKQGGTTSIADRLRNRKALDLLVENARVTDEEWREEEETEQAEEASAAAESSNAAEEPKTESASEDETETKADSSSTGA